MQKIIVMLTTVVALAMASSAQAQVVNGNGMPLSQEQTQVVNRLHLSDQQVATLNQLNAHDRGLLNGLTKPASTNMKVSAPPTILVHVWAAIRQPLDFVVGITLLGIMIYGIGVIAWMFVSIGRIEISARRSAN